MKTLDIARHEHCRLNQGFPNVIYMQELDNIDKKLEALEIIKKELNLEVKEDNGLYRLVTYQSDNHLLRKDQFALLKEITNERTTKERF